MNPPVFILCSGELELDEEAVDLRGSVFNAFA